MANHKIHDTPADAQRAAHLAWRMRNPEKYKANGSRQRPKEHCAVCDKWFTYGYLKHHVLSSKHLKMVEDNCSECETVVE